MSTHSSIGIIQPNRKVIAVYCHSDGYLDGVGKTLNKYYRDPAKVSELINLGYNGISSIGKEIGEKQTFKDSVEGWCLFYGRDRGDKDRMTYKYNSVSDFKDGFDTSYGYLYDPESNIWFAFTSEEGLTYIPGQSKSLVNSMWKKIGGSVDESKQFSLAQTAKKILNEAKKIKPYDQVKVGDMAYENPDAGGQWNNKLGKVLWKGTIDQLKKSEFKELKQNWYGSFKGYDLIVIDDLQGPTLYNYDNDPSGCVVFK